MAYKVCVELETVRSRYDREYAILPGLFFSQRKTIRMIEFYTASRYLLSQKDELGREKPFYNIVNAMNDVENAAKDIDLKDIEITSDDNNHYTESFLMTKDLYEWGKATNFSKILNDMRDTHTRYGSLLVKKVKKDIDGTKMTLIEIPEWKNVITNQVDILSGTIAEIHYMTPREIAKMDAWDKKSVKALMKKLVQGDLSRRIPVFEVRGWFPLSFYKELEGEKSTPKDEITFTYQLFYLAGSPQYEDSSVVTGFSDTLSCLYWENDTEEVYKYLARKPRAGRAFGVGVVEEGEQAQIWTNDTVIKQYRAMEYTTKVVGQSASKKLKGRNLLSEVDDGQILEHDDGKPITQLNLLPSGGLNQYQSIITQWYAQYEKTTSAYAAQRGETPPSGTPFRLQASVLQQSNSVFEDLQEELGIFITEIYNEWLMPDVAAKLNQKHILAHEFSPEELKEIDKNFSLHYANSKVKELVLSGKIVLPEEYDAFMKSADEVIKQTKTQRFLEVPKDYYKGWKAKVTVNVTGEQRDKAAILESLLNIMTVYSKNPAIAQDPVLTQLFMRIVELSGAGISPVSLMGAIQERSAMQLKQQEQAQALAEAGGEPQEAPALAPQPA